MADCNSGIHLIGEIEEARCEGRVGVLLLGNVDDRIMESGQDSGAPLAIPYALLRHLARQGFATGTAGISTGLAPVPVPGIADGSASVPTVAPDAGPEQILRAVTALLQDSNSRVAIILRHPGHFAPRTDHPTEAQLVCAEIIYGWSADERTRRAGSFVILLEPGEGVHHLIRERAAGFKVIRAGYPSQEDRRAYVSGWMKRSLETVEVATVEQVALHTGGLRLVELDALLRGAAGRGESVQANRIRTERAARISERLGGIAEVKEPTIAWDDVAGLGHVKDHFRDVARASRLGPRGITGSTLLAGVPGVGKSFTAEALARELGVPIVFVRNLYDQWVGSSEARVERLIETLSAFDGCVCVFEEIDQLLGRRDGGPSADGGTTERVRGRMMEFMGGTYPGIHFVGLTNRPDLLDVANQDRFSLLIPVLHPGLRDRIELFPALFAQERREAGPSLDFEAIANHPNLRIVSVRSLRDLVRMAGRMADRESERLDAPIEQRHLARVIDAFRPNYDRKEHEFLALMAIAGCQFHAYLPWMSWEGRRKDADLPAYLEGIVDPVDGTVDAEALSRRVATLAEDRARSGR